MTSQWWAAARKSTVGILVCIAILAAGLVGHLGLAALQKPPAQAEQKETAIRVETRQVYPEPVPVILTGTGEVRSLNVVPIAPEVSGRVANVHPNLEVGGVIPAGEVLFEIDPRDYQARLTDAQATHEMNRNTVTRLHQQYGIDQERLKTLERSRDLARSEFVRVKELFEKDEVGTQSGVDQAERAYNATADLADQLAQAVALYPVRLKEAENSQAGAEARVDLARVSAERTVLRAPFNARVKSVTLEAGQYVNPGAPVVTLADDSVLEISVPLDSREARRWLKFSAGEEGGADSWFRNIEPVACEIRWTEDREGHFWEGVLHRVEKFDEKTRTVTVAVRIEGEKAQSKDPDLLPLVQGMFCGVSIPGRTLDNAYRLPSTAVTYDDLVYLAVDGRLKTVKVERALVLGEDIIISGGLNPGDTVISTRLVNPLENSLLDIAADGKGPAS
jgi:multidrug efflux pump subunit AcrA (membrane-fusion protein)